MALVMLWALVVPVLPAASDPLVSQSGPSSQPEASGSQVVPVDPESTETAVLMPVGDSITIGSTNAPGPQGTYRMFLYDRLVDRGLVVDDFDFVGPYSDHPGVGYQRQGQWPHGALAVSGWRTNNVRDAIADAFEAFEPDVLLMLIGINDLRGGVSAQDAADNVRLAIQTVLDQEPGTGVLLAEIPPANSPADAVVLDYNARLRGVAEELRAAGGEVWTVDLFTDYDVGDLHYDGLHPNDAGDAFIAERFADALAQRFGIEVPVQAPEVQITAGPVGTVQDTSATFEFTSDTLGASFECRLDGGVWEACTSPHTVTDLAEGQRTFQVRATAEGVVGEPASRTWTVAVPTDPDPVDFPDVAPDSVHAESIRRLVAAGITQGFEDGTFRPALPVTRQQMATFLTRALGLEVPDERFVFTDVSEDNVHFDAIQALAAAGITLGCDEQRFCPDESVTRQAMASFLTRALDLEVPAEIIVFDDVSEGSVHFGAIQALAAAEITLGCGPGVFCPSDPVRRDQMASFLVRALDL